MIKEKRMNHLDWTIAIVIYLLSVASVGYQYAMWRWNAWDGFAPFHSNVRNIAFPITGNNSDENNMFVRLRKEPQPYIMLVAGFWPLNMAANAAALLCKFLMIVFWVATICIVGGLIGDRENEGVEET